MKAITSSLLALVAASAVSGEEHIVVEGDTQLRFEDTEPWMFRILDKAGNITERYVQMQYNYVGEVDNDGNPCGTHVTGEQDVEWVGENRTNYYYSRLAVNNTDSGSTAYLATTFFLAKDGFNYTTVPIDSQENEVCGSMGANGTAVGNCVDATTVNSGDTKFNFYVKGFTYNNTCSHMRMQMRIHTYGFNHTTAYFNGNPNYTNVSDVANAQFYQANFGDEQYFTQWNIPQIYNKNGETFETAKVTLEMCEDQQSGCINVDMPTAGLTVNDYLFYDPTIKQVAFGESLNSGSSGDSSDDSSSSMNSGSSTTSSSPTSSDDGSSAGSKMATVSGGLIALAGSFLYALF